MVFGKEKKKKKKCIRVHVLVAFHVPFSGMFIKSSSLRHQE